MIRSIACVLALVAGWGGARPAAAASIANAAGTTGVVGLNLGATARAMGQGGAGAAGEAEAGAVWFNPARLSGLEAPEASFLHGIWIADTSLDQLAVAGPLLGGVTAGAVTVLHMPAIDSFDNVGAKTGSFAPYEAEVTAAWAGRAGPLSVGGAATVIDSALADGAAATGISADAGAVFAPDPALVVGGAIQHVGSTLTYGTATTKLPLDVRAGGVLTVAGRTRFAADVLVPQGASVAVRGGGEQTIVVGPEVAVALRAGWRSDAPTGAAGGITAGAGVTWRSRGGFDSQEREVRGMGGESSPVRELRVDYAWTPMGDLGPAHWIAVAVGF